MALPFNAPRRTQVFRMTSAEKKNIDTAVGFPGIATGGVLTCINPSQALPLPTARIGRRVTQTSIFLRGDVSLAATSTGSCAVRILVVYDKQPNKALPNITDILVTDTIGSVNALANSHRFKVLRDVLIPCLGTAGPQAGYVNEYIKCNLETEFIDGTGAGTIADITSGALLTLVYANNNIVTQQINHNITARVRFADL